MLPVVSTMEPNLLDSAISRVPRMRDCRFSSVVSASRPSNSGASTADNASKGPPIGRTL